MTAAVEIVDAADRGRFEATLDGVLVGVADYSRGDGLMVLPHTLVEPAYERRGIGAALARAALDDARTRGLRVVPRCSFIAAYLDRHPEYADLDTRP